MLKICPFQRNGSVAETDQSEVHRSTINPKSRETVTLAADLLQIRPGARENVEIEKSDFPQSFPSLAQLSARAVCGGVESLDELDGLLCEIEDLNGRTEGPLGKLLLEATPGAVRDSILSLREQAKRQFPEPTEGKVPWKTRCERFDMAHDAVMKWGASGLIADALQLEGEERNWLELCAVRHLGIPRVQKGESCKQVLTDLGIGKKGPAKDLLQAFAVKGPGVLRVKKGEDWRDVLESLGVDPDMKVRRSPEPNVEYILRKAAILSQGVDRVRNGEDTDKILGEFGFGKTCPSYDLKLDVHRQLWKSWADYNELPPEPPAEEHYQQVINEVVRAYAA